MFVVNGEGSQLTGGLWVVVGFGWFRAQLSLFGFRAWKRQMLKVRGKNRPLFEFSQFFVVSYFETRRDI